MRMQAVVVRESASPTSLGSHTLVNRFDLEEVDLQGPGAGEVLVEVAAAGICHSDLSVINGDRIRSLPLVLGHEATGTVREVGPGVQGLQQGDTVVFTFVPVCGVCRECQSGKPALCRRGNAANVSGELLSGTKPFRDATGHALNHHNGVSAFSPFTVVARESLVRVATDIPATELALFGCAVLTGVGAVFNTAKIAPGETVVVFGCGGVGLSAILGARAVGAGRIIAVDIDKRHLRWADRVGADVTLVSDSNVVEAIRDLTHGGADACFEAAGRADVLRDAYESAGPGGQVVAIGLANPASRVEISPSQMVVNEKVLRGSYMGSAVPARDIPRYVSLYELGRLPVDRLFGGTHPIEQSHEAFTSLIEGDGGRQVFTFGSSS